MQIWPLLYGLRDCLFPETMVALQTTKDLVSADSQRLKYQHTMVFVRCSITSTPESAMLQTLPFF